jgi:tRNA-splicing ligase RtcB (3'-phosphate/5'-hydroxy nucleic acid ligase)
MRHLDRVLGALARRGLSVSKEGPVYQVSDGRGQAQVLLPETFPLDQKALAQLCAFAGVAHPSGGRVCAACATPDFHAGALVPVGTVLVTTADMVVPQAIGTDIQCGMRLHVADLSLESFLARKKEWVTLMQGDLLLGTRDLAMRVRAVRAMLAAGAFGWLEVTKQDPLGMLARADLAQIERELDRCFELSSFEGDVDYAPQDLLPDDRDVVRDSCMGTMGSGNHFVEVQTVAEILDGPQAFAWGVRKGQLAFMVHSGSRRVGTFIGNEWMSRARERWPAGVKHPESGIYPLYGSDAAEYVAALHTAANYANVNRLLLGEMVRARTRQVFGRELEVPLVFDVPHNTVTREREGYVHRKGATPAHAGQPVLIPGSMGQSSYLMAGLGNEAFLSSASHGAGRARTRADMRQRAARGQDVGADQVECITLKAERLIEEAPAAYNAIDPVIEVQARVGIAKPVARLAPVLTFKA